MDTERPCHDCPQVFLEELLGETGEEKEVDKIAAKHKETKSTRAYDVFEIIGRTLDFEYLPSHVIEAEGECSVRASVLESATLKARRKLRELLRRLGVSLTTCASISNASGRHHL